MQELKASHLQTESWSSKTVQNSKGTTRYDILIVAIGILIAIGFTAIFIELLVFCVRPISMLAIVGTVAIFLIITLLVYVQCRIEKMFEQSEPYHIRAELFKAIVYDETRIYPGYSNKKKKITDKKLIVKRILILATIILLSVFTVLKERKIVYC